MVRFLWENSTKPWTGLKKPEVCQSPLDQKETKMTKNENRSIKEILKELILEACSDATDITIFASIDSFVVIGEVMFTIESVAEVNFEILGTAFDMSEVELDIVSGTGFYDHNLEISLQIREDYYPFSEDETK